MAGVKSLSDTLRYPSVNANKWTETLAGSMTSTPAATGYALNFPASSTASTSGQLLGAGQLDLTGSDVFLHVKAFPAAGTHADARIALLASGSNNNRLEWLYEAGQLQAHYYVAGVETILATIAVGSISWLRFRESGGTTFFDTSLDGVTWTNQGSHANPITLTAVQAVIQGSCFQNETSPGNFTFELYNVYAEIPDIFRPRRQRRLPGSAFRRRRASAAGPPGTQNVQPPGGIISLVAGTPTLLPGGVTITATGGIISLAAGSAIFAGAVQGGVITLVAGHPTLLVANPSGATERFLLEDGSAQLLEDGSFRLLETASGTTPPPPPPPPPPVAPGDHTIGPTVRLVTARALVVPHQIQRWVLPIICAEHARGGTGDDVEIVQDVHEVRAFFLELRRTGTPVIYQEGGDRHTVVVRDVQFPDGSVNRWGTGRNGLQGLLLVTVDSTEA